MKIKIENSAGGIVYKKIDNKYFWLMVSNQRSTYYWGFPKGHIADKISNELAEEAALREVQEEGGIAAKIVFPEAIKVRYKFRQEASLHDKTVLYFLMEYVSGETTDHDTEVDEAILVTEEELLKKLTYDNDKNAFLKAKKLLAL